MSSLHTHAQLTIKQRAVCVRVCAGGGGGRGGIYILELKDQRGHLQLCVCLCVRDTLRERDIEVD